MQTLALYNLYLTRAAAALAALATLCVFLYAAFLLLAIEHTAARTVAEHQIAHLTAQLGDSESQYLTATRLLTPEYAAALGYVAPATVAVVYSTPAAGALSINSNR